MTKYLIDTNVFIEAWDQFDCHDFFDWVEEAHKSKLASSTMAVDREINGEIGADLRQWADDHNNIFIGPPVETFNKVKILEDWARSEGYSPTAISVFFKKADYSLVAHACASSCIVVTQETKDNNVDFERIKIPNACEALGVGWMPAIEMLRAEKAAFLNNPRCRATLHSE